MVNQRKTKKFLPKPKNPKLTPIGMIGNEPLILPNRSGDHSRGKVLSTPNADTDLVNKSYVDTQIAAVIPSGLIAIWTGTIANIPTGWALCDGTNGTPDLTDKFVISVVDSETDPGTTGGAASHDHAISGNTANTDVSHTHTITSNTGNVDLEHTHTNSNTGSSDANHNHGQISGNSDGESSHTHSISLTSGAGSSHSHGSGSYVTATPSFAGKVAQSASQVFCGDHSHNISGTSDTEAAHTHGVYGSSAAGSSHYHGSGSYTTNNADATHTHTLSNTGASLTTHVHTCPETDSSLGNHLHSISLTSGTASTYPPYYEVAFIMKL